MNLKSSFMQQLSALERRLADKSKQALSNDWDANFGSLEGEDLLLRNTYLNGQMGPLAEFHSGMHDRHMPRRLWWLDQDSHDKNRLEKPAGADRHNIVSQASELKGILRRKPRAMPRQTSAGAGPTPGALAGPGAPPGAEGSNGGYRGPEVPTVWADEGEAHHRPHGMPGSSSMGQLEASRGSGSPMPGPGRDVRDVRDGRESREIPYRKGPTTGIRDSLTGPMGRRSESPVPEERRASSNDPPPRGSSRRNESPQLRGDPTRGRYPSVSQSSGYQSSGPQSFGLFGRTPTPGVGSQRGMGAFRGGGPVRAKADLLGDSTRPPGRARPSTAPSTPTRSGSMRRPASPGAQMRSGSSSRPPSPNSRSQSGPPMTIPTRHVPGHSYPTSSPFDRSTAQRSMSSHLRRAPSPTPAFNASARNSSPKPRWRS